MVHEIKLSLGSGVAEWEGINQDTCILILLSPLSGYVTARSYSKQSFLSGPQFPRFREKTGEAGRVELLVRSHNFQIL